MTGHRFPPAARAGWPIVLGLIGMALTAAPPAAAQAALTQQECETQGQVTVHFPHGYGEATLVAQPDGTYAGTIEVYADCKLSNVKGSATRPPVLGVTVVLTTTLAGATISPPRALTGADGRASFVVTAPSTILAAGVVSAQVGEEIVTVASGLNLGANDTEKLWAQTPELSSLALFGAGSAGLAGYGLLRLRTVRRGRKGRP